jgi:hypothetical protein
MEARPEFLGRRGKAKGQAEKGKDAARILESGWVRRNEGRSRTLDGGGNRKGIDEASFGCQFVGAHLFFPIAP